MKLTYWKADCWSDSHAYSIRAKTKKECIALRAEARETPEQVDDDFGPVEKVTVTYDSGFDLLEQVAGDPSAY